jgi:hypothetical protein
MRFVGEYWYQCCKLTLWLIQCYYRAPFNLHAATCTYSECTCKGECLFIKLSFCLLSRQEPAGAVRAVAAQSQVQDALRPHCRRRKKTGSVVQVRGIVQLHVRLYMHCYCMFKSQHIHECIKASPGPAALVTSASPLLFSARQSCF